MRAQIIRSFGEADVFEREELPRPALGPSQVLIRVGASSVNTADVKARELGHALDFVPDLPAVLGMDVAGTVDAVGADVQAFTPGDAVYGCAGGVRGHGGALAEYLVADARLLAHKPVKLSMEEAAALPLVSITAWEALYDRMDVAPGDRVLVHGGAGGVGHIAIQLARARGAWVAATGRGAGQLDLIARLGAEPIDWSAEEPSRYVARLTGGEGFDSVFDTVGTSNIVISFEGARHGGQVATTVSLATVDLSIAHAKGLSLHVIYMLLPMLHGPGRERHGRILTALAQMADAGLIRPLIDSVFPLDRVADAHRRLEAGRMMGKVVVTVSPEDRSRDA